jgi:hypothetical protein
MLSIRLGQWQAQEAASFLCDLFEVDQSAALADNIEQVAMLARGRIGPFSGGTGAGGRPGQSNKHGSTRGVLNVANQPVMPLLPPVRQIVSAHRFGILCKLA